MNKRKMLLAVIPVALGVLLSGCGVEENITINKNLSSKVTAKFYTTSAEEAAISENLEGVTYEDMMKEMECKYAGTTKIKGVEHNIYQSSSKVSKKDTRDMFVTLSDTQAVMNMMDLTENLDDLENQGMDASADVAGLDYAVINIKYPFKVYKTNGILQKDGYTVQYPLENQKLERIYAVSAAKYANSRKCTISGVKNKGYYRKNKTVKAESDGVIMSFKVNNVSQTTNSYTATEDGTYTVKAKMLAGNTKTVKFVIDKTKPVTNIKAKTYHKKVTITFKDKTSGVKTATLNGKKIRSGKVVSKTGSYVLKITDKAGNVRTVKFSIK